MSKKETRQGIELLRGLVNEGLRIFTVSEAKGVAERAAIKSGYVVEALHHLKRRGWICSVKRGVYAITEESGFSFPPHDYEIAMALVSGAVISHWTALYHHHLTQQMPQTIYCLVPTGRRIPGAARERSFQYTQIKPELLLGFDEVWIGEGRVRVTDPERTLLDGLRQPQLCGGTQEVLGAFEVYWSRLDVEKIVGYALKLEGAVVSRLGWVLKQNGYEGDGMVRLQKGRAQGRRRLDASGPDKGPIDRDWQIRENIGI